MAAREPTLPEGTDSIIDTNTDIGSGAVGGRGTSVGGGATTGASGGATSASTTTASETGGGSTAGGSTTGGSGAGAAFQFDKSGDGNEGGGGVSKATDSVIGQIKDQVSSLKGQAGDRARGFADDGKRQATDILSSLAQVLQDAAGSVEERLGSQYSGFGNRAADAVSSLSSRIDEKSIEDLIDDAREFVRRSPAIAIGVAALIGFAVARVARSGVSEMSSGGQEGNGSTGTGAGSAGAA